MRIGSNDFFFPCHTLDDDITSHNFEPQLHLPVSPLPSPLPLYPQYSLELLVKMLRCVSQEKEFEVTNEYIFALGSHVIYWSSKDVSLFVAQQVYSDAIAASKEPGIR